MSERSVYYTKKSDVYHDDGDCRHFAKNGGQECSGSLSRVAVFRRPCSECVGDEPEVIEP